LRQGKGQPPSLGARPGLHNFHFLSPDVTRVLFMTPPELIRALPQPVEVAVKSGGQMLY